MSAAKRSGGKQRGSAEGQTVNPYTFLPFTRQPPPERHSAPPSRAFAGATGEGLTPADPAALRSGRIRLRLQVRTPVALHGAEQSEPATHTWRDRTGRYEPTEPANTGHRRVTLPLDAAGRPVLFGSSLKGVLRSWVEAVTASPRLFTDQTVAWRATSVTAVQPGQLRLWWHGKPDTTLDATERGLTLAKLEKRLQQGLSVQIEPMSEAPPRDGRPFRERNVELVERIVDLGDHLVDGGDVTLRSGRPTPAGWTLKVSAGVGKRPVSASVQVFFPPVHETEPIRVDPEVVLDWFAAHCDGGSPAKTVEAQLSGTNWRGTVTPLDARKLYDGVPIWYSLENGRVSYFGRLRHGRWASRDPLQPRVPGGHKPPPPPLLSPAERMFGTVGESREGLRGRHQRDATAPEPLAWAGRVRPLTARWRGDRPAEAIDSVTLGVLSAPKLQSAGLYLTNPAGRPASWGPADPDSELRGTKVCWHHPDKAPQGRPAQLDGDTPKTTQNATVDVVTDGAFDVDVAFEDLTDLELGALLVACSLRFTDEDCERGWKLGMGKPLGLGSVANTVEEVVVYDTEARLADPLSLQAGMRPLGQAQQRELEQQALQFYLPHHDDRRVFSGVAELEALDRQAATPRVAYPERGELGRTAQGLSHHQPTAAEILGLR